MFSDDRRESTCGANQSPPAVVVLNTRVGVVPVRPLASPVSCGWSASESAPRNVTVTFAVLTGPPVAVALPGPTVLNACSADTICAAVELNASGLVVWPLKVSVNVPPWRC